LSVAIPETQPEQADVQQQRDADGQNAAARPAQPAETVGDARRYYYP
jgi:hypothetical protein